jgi:hypothetical protein
VLRPSRICSQLFGALIIQNDAVGRLTCGEEKNEIESADDFILTQPTKIDHISFKGLLTGTNPTPNQVRVEILRVFPKDSDVTRTSGPPTFSTSIVPTRVNSPSDVVIAAINSEACGPPASRASVCRSS